MAFSETLAYLRKSKGLSQEQLAQELDITRQTISKWELNQSTPDIDYLLRLSEYFEVSTDYLLKGRFDEDIKNSSDTNGVEAEERKRIVYMWCFCLGAIITGISLIGIIAFVILSALHPWTVEVNDRVYEGLLGFLKGSHTLWFFVVLSILLVVGGFSIWYCLMKLAGIKRGEIKVVVMRCLKIQEEK